MMVGERRNGNLLVQLGPKLQAQPEELLRQRRSPDGHTEYLIRWAVQSLEDGAGSNGATSQAESKAPNIQMWMSAEEVYANCPTLLGKRKSEGPGVLEEKESRAPDEGALQEMREDVRTLVQRAAGQISQNTGPDASILNTIHVLSAYASIGSLAGVFKETGALDLLMKMLCNQEKQIRKNAGKMLRALASHDAGSRAHVLLSLSQQDGIEQHMDFDSRYTLLQLFAETTSSEEHCISFEGIHLPQIPGKQLFSLVKRYLCVTSLVDQLSSEQPDHSERSRLQRQFDFSMAVGSLICELVRVMGWDSEQHLRVRKEKVVRSIFQARGSARSAPRLAAPRIKKTTNSFKMRADFSSRSGYVTYMQQTLRPGMSVRMLEDYEQASAGDQGEYRQSNEGTPPVQVYWQSLGRTYWVHWHTLEIVSSCGQVAEKESQEKACSLTETLKVTPVTQTLRCKPSGGLYSLPYLAGAASDESGTLRQDEWWELLFFIRRLETPEQRDVQDLIKQEGERLDLGEQVLMQMLVPVDVAHKLLRFLSERCRGSLLNDLQSSHVYSKYFLRRRGAAEQQRLLSDPPLQENLQGGLLSKKLKKEDEPPSSDKPGALPSAEKSDLQLLNELLTAEGLQHQDVDIEESSGESNGPDSEQDARMKRTLENCRELMHQIRQPGWEIRRKMSGLRLIQWVSEHNTGGDTQAVTAQLRRNMVKMLVELLTNQMKEKLLMVTCLQLTYVVMSKYDWRVLFATEGGVRAVLGCMQEHQSSAAIQHAGLA
ncbi:cullin-9-like, partial [Ascaphus truei]|uniref:cullin-9-like n=1 Tax=Ascaphus truei TaxID=8439 RepID=UPI003F5A793A